MHVFIVDDTLIVAFLVCVQVPLLFSKLLLLVKILPHDDVSPHSYQKGSIILSSGGKI